MSSTQRIFLQRLQNLSLLFSLDLDRRTFRLHDTVRHFLLEKVGKDALESLHKHLLKAFDEIKTDRSADEASRRYFFRHRPGIWPRQASAQRWTPFFSIRVGFRRSSMRLKARSR